jgi:type IV secretory pathway VirB2 component (pilin)
MKGVITLAKIKTVRKASEIMNREVKEQPVKKDVRQIVKVSAMAATALLVTVPDFALAAGSDDTFSNVRDSLMNGFDHGVEIVIIFAGAAWGLGHRTKAIEILIGVCCGYVLARHSTDIRDFLKGI